MVIISLPFHLLYIYYCPVNILKTLGIGYNSRALWGCGQKHAHGYLLDIGYNGRALWGCGQKHAHGSQFDIGYNSRVSPRLSYWTCS